MEELGSDWYKEENNNTLIFESICHGSTSHKLYYYHKGAKKYEAQCNINGKLKGLGLYNTPEEAFNVYKIAKENEIKRVANDCILKGFITKDNRLYKAMINYQVEIAD